MKVLKTIINGKEVKRRDADGLTKKQLEKLNKIIAVKELKDKGLSQNEIAKMSNISIATIKRYYKKIKEDFQNSSVSKNVG